MNCLNTHSVRTPGTKERISSFVRKTYEILDQGKYSEIVSWSPDGTCVVIKDVTSFAQLVLPAYFKHNNMTSFVRQLNMYDFHKKKSTGKEQIYQHDFFQRGKKQLLKNVKRKGSETSYDKNEHIYQAPDSIKYETIWTPNMSQETQLMKINQEAYARIRLLEDKVREMTAENQELMKKLTEKEEKESYMKTVLSQLGDEQVPILQKMNANFNHKIITQGAYKDIPNVKYEEAGEPASNLDAFLNFDNTTSCSWESSEFTQSENGGEDQGSAALGKRKLDPQAAELKDAEYKQDPKKIPCYESFGDFDKNNWPDFDLSIADLVSQRA